MSASNQNSSNPHQKQPNPISIVAFLVLVIPATIGIFQISINPCDIRGLSDQLKSCKDKERANDYGYNWAVGQAIAARTLAQNPSNVNQLEKARDLITNAIVHLKTIPLDAKVYSEAQKVLPGYESELKEMEDRIKKWQAQPVTPAPTPIYQPSSSTPTPAPITSSSTPTPAPITSRRQKNKTSENSGGQTGKAKSHDDTPQPDPECLKPGPNQCLF